MTPLRHHALLVGIDRYCNLPAHAQLRSCVNDARLIAGTLCGRFGFRPDEIRLLLDEDATQAGIRAALDAIRAAVRAGDAVVFYYSGHGSKTRDRDGDEPGGMDETLFPHDSGRKPYPNRDIIDDELHEWLLAVSAVTANLVMIADTCFSGGVARDAAPGGGLSKWVTPDCRPAHELPPPAVAGRRTHPRSRDTAAAGLLPLDDRYVLLAACRAGEHAKEMRSQPQSVFTFHLCQELHRAPAGATYRDVIEQVRLAVAAEVADQMPQLEGARDRILFGEETSRPAPFLPVAARQGRSVSLGGGAVHGVDAGALWSIHPAGAAHPAAGQRRGLVRITAVQAAAAEAEILEDHGPIGAGDRAFEQARGPGWMRLTVATDAADAADPAGTDGRAAGDLAAEILRSPLLRLAQPGEPAELHVLRAGPEAGPPPAAGREAAEPPLLVEEPSWVVLTREHGLALPPVPRDGPTAAGRLVDALEALARARNLLAIEPTAEEDSSARDRLEVELLRRRGGSFQPAEPDPSGDVVFVEGEPVALRVTHHAGRPLHIHVLDIGLAAAVSLVHPVPGANDPLESDRPFEIGTRPGEEMVLEIPQELVARCRAAGQPEIAGREAVRVFATEAEADLSGWQQDSATRGSTCGASGAGAAGNGDAAWAGGSVNGRTGGAAGGLARQLARAQGRDGDDGSRVRGDAPPAADGGRWSVRTLSFLVRRPV